MIQGGPLPCFMDDNLLRKRFGYYDGDVLNSAEEQLRDGFSRFGLVEVRL